MTDRIAVTGTPDALATGLERLHAVDLGDGEYAYYASETACWYLTDESDVRLLGEALLAGDDEAYSTWCATWGGSEVDDTDHVALDRIADATDQPVAYRCQCGTALGERCTWVGDRGELCHVKWVPESDRGSARASGTYGAYATSLQVTRECAEVLRYEWEGGEPTEREDEYVRVVGPAYAAD